MHPPVQTVDRRVVLQGLGFLTAAAIGPPLGVQAAMPADPHVGHPSATSGTYTCDITGKRSGAGRSWHDPRAWADGRVPGRKDIATVRGHVRLGRDVRVAGVRIEEGGVLEVDPAASVVLTSTGNVVVRGVLRMRPASPAVQHRLTFAGINEAKVIGGGMEVLDSDVGLWVVAAGVLDAVGSPKRSWSRLLDGATAGSRSVAVEDTTGWQVGDRVVITPTIPPTPEPGSRAHADAYDDAVITAVGVGRVDLDRPLAVAHPLVADAFGNRWTAEVLNLSRNVVVEGTAGGRAHVMFLHTTTPQHLSDVELRHVGPRTTYVNERGKTRTRTTLGRYGLHFHFCDSGSAGSVVRGVVVHDAGNHAFVPHSSHGVTFEDCVSHDTWAEPYWWDVAPRGDVQVPTHDTLYLNCVASRVRAEQSTPEAYRLSAFHLGKGAADSNMASGCVAVGVDDGMDTSGFTWPERSQGVWGFDGCLAHNNVQHGALSWQNNEAASRIGEFDAYHNGGAGILHGAYANFWTYENADLYGNREAGLVIAAVSRRTGYTMRTFPQPYPLLTFRGLRIDGGGISRHGIASAKHRFAAQDGVPTVIESCDVRGARVASFHMGPWNNREEYAIRACSLAAPEFDMAPGMNPTSFASVTDLMGAPVPFTVWRLGAQVGVDRPDWNGVMVPEVPVVAAEVEDEATATGEDSPVRQDPSVPSSPPETTVLEPAPPTVPVNEVPVSEVPVLEIPAVNVPPLELPVLEVPVVDVPVIGG